MPKAFLPSPAPGHGLREAPSAASGPTDVGYAFPQEANASTAVLVNNKQDSHPVPTYTRGVRWKSLQQGNQIVPATVAPAGTPDEAGFAVFATDATYSNAFNNKTTSSRKKRRNNRKAVPATTSPSADASPTVTLTVSSPSLSTPSGEHVAWDTYDDSLSLPDPESPQRSYEEADDALFREADFARFASPGEHMSAPHNLQVDPVAYRLFTEEAALRGVPSDDDMYSRL